ncbi:hypothetical protein E2C01_078660 [Portunus trituberculatus]|uniref:Uncharacterized protein n=1 Tax=Portunus trituberculatus TaxID=210409 RepID=A0A5B7IQT6_PORTR|nr:hypothetical protein [Portunus trituberculatus]
MHALDSTLHYIRQDRSEQSFTVASQSRSAVFLVVCGLADLTRRMKCPHLIHIIVLLLACLFFIADTCELYTVSQPSASLRSQREHLSSGDWRQLSLHFSPFVTDGLSFLAYSICTLIMGNSTAAHRPALPYPAPPSPTPRCTSLKPRKQNPVYSFWRFSFSKALGLFVSLAHRRYQ